MPIYAEAYQAVKDPEKLTVAVRDYLKRGGEHLDLRLEIQSLRTDLGSANRQIDASKRKGQRLERELAREGKKIADLVTRILPFTGTESHLHYLEARSHLIVTEGQEKEDGFTFYQIYWIDNGLRASSVSTRFHYDKEDKLAAKIAELLAQLRHTLIAGPEPHHLRKWSFAGYLFGTTDQDFTDQLGVNKDFNREGIREAMLGVSPYLAVGRNLALLGNPVHIKARNETMVHISKRGPILEIIPIAPPPSE